MWGQESLILFLVSGAVEGRKVLEHPRAKSHPFTLPLVRVSGGRFEITPKYFATEGKIMAADALTPFLPFPSPLSTRPAHTPFNLQVSRCHNFFLLKVFIPICIIFVPMEAILICAKCSLAEEKRETIFRNRNKETLAKSTVRSNFLVPSQSNHILKKKIYYF